MGVAASGLSRVAEAAAKPGGLRDAANRRGLRSGVVDDLGIIVGGLVGAGVLKTIGGRAMPLAARLVRTAGADGITQGGIDTARAYTKGSRGAALAAAGGRGVFVGALSSLAGEAAGHVLGRLRGTPGQVLTGAAPETPRAAAPENPLASAAVASSEPTASSLLPRAQASKLDHPLADGKEFRGVNGHAVGSRLIVGPTNDFCEPIFDEFPIVLIEKEGSDLKFIAKDGNEYYYRRGPESGRHVKPSFSDPRSLATRLEGVGFSRVDDGAWTQTTGNGKRYTVLTQGNRIVAAGKHINLPASVEGVTGTFDQPYSVAAVRPVDWDHAAPVTDHFGHEHLPVGTMILSDDLGEVYFERRGHPLNATLNRTPTPAEVGVRPVIERTSQSGFVVGGVNTTETIRNLTHLNDTAIAELERKMRPKGSVYSGFLGPDEKLLEVMAQDNDYVMSQDLTHQQIGNFLHYLVNHNGMFPGSPINLGGKEARIIPNRLIMNGSVGSPLDSISTGSRNYELQNPHYQVPGADSPGGRTFFSELGYKMIRDHGFYQGPGSSYRVDPEDIVDLFGADAIRQYGTP